MCSANKNISLKNDDDFSTDESDKEFIRKSKLYTKTGDKGCTGLYSGERREKTEPIFHTLGAIDELNCELGICKVHYYNIMKSFENKIYTPPGNGWSRTEKCAKTGKYYEWLALGNILSNIQTRLIELSSHIATVSGEYMVLAIFDTDNKHLSDLERLIDRLDSVLPKLTTFLIPGGDLLTAHLHKARTIARKSERLIWDIKNSGFDHITEGSLKYMNRMSDFLFVLSRFTSFSLGSKETRFSKLDIDDNTYFKN